MAGRAYTMREMRSIVEYLNERKAYGEIRGRKLWVEFASTDKTTRTWQSLKETFLKRILPDIQNPYYNLTMDEAQSFRLGHDMVEKEKNNRLEFRIASGESNGLKSHENQKNISTTKTDIDVPSSSKNISNENEINEGPASSIDEALEKATGEGITAAKIPSRCRSSADTYVLEYENAEDIRKDLESPGSNNKENKKSLKDQLIFEYTAPLTPAVKELLDDFETESECSDKESQSKVAATPTVEIPDSQPASDVGDNIELKDNDTVNNKADPTVKISESDNVSTNTNNNTNIAAAETSKKDSTSKSEKPSENLQVSSVAKNSRTLDSSVSITNVNNIRKCDDMSSYAEATTKEITELTAESVSKIDKTSDETNKDVNTLPNTGTSTQNTSSDTFIPNNQEAWTEPSNDKSVESLEKSKLSLKRSANRSSSRESRERKKTKPTEDMSKHNKTETIPVIELDSSEQESNPKVDDISSKQATDAPNNTTFDLDSMNQPSTSKMTTKTENKSTIDIEEEIPSINVYNERKVQGEVNPKDRNPCLKSVNLFEEQFNNTQYSDSEPEQVVQPPKKQNIEKPTAAGEKKGKEGKPQILINKEVGKEEVAKTKVDKETGTNVATKIKGAEVNNKKETGKKPQLEVAVTHRKETAEKPIPEPVKETKGEFKKPGNITVVEDAETEILDSGSDSEPKTNIGNVQHIVAAVNSLDSSSDQVPQTINVVKNVQIPRTSEHTAQRERALANVFGFANGGVASSRKRCKSHQRRSHHHRRRKHSRSASSESEWTSEEDSDYVSPPRGSRARGGRRYLKPKRGSIIQDCEEGMMYVILGKKIYPLVNDSRQGMNYLTYHPADDSADTYWKQKYMDEKQRADENKKLLESLTSQSKQAYDLTEPSTSRNSAPRYPKKNTNNANTKESVDLTVEKPEPKGEKMVLKIATKTGVEYCLEGDWNQISHAVPQVVKLAHSDVSNASSKSSNGVPGTKLGVDVEVQSEEVTPVEEVQEKINKLESEIFNKIEALDKGEDGIENEKDTANVTKRQTVRRRNESSTSSITAAKSPAKRTRTSKTISVDSKESSTETKRTSKTQLKETKQIENKEIETKEATEEQLEVTEEEKPKRRGRKMKEEVPDKVNTPNSKTNDSKPASRSSSRLSKQRDASESGKSTVDDNTSTGRRPRQLRTPKKYAPEQQNSLSAKSSKESDLLGFDDNDRFMFPAETTSKTSVKSAGKNGSMPEIYIIPPPEELKISIDTTGYLDSDTSPLKLILPKRKRRVSYIARKIISNRRLSRRRSLPMFLERSSTDSSVSSYFIPLRRSTSSRSSADSILPGEKNTSRSNLDPIDEIAPQDIDRPTSENESDCIRHFNSVSKNTTTVTLNTDDLTGILLELGSSSSVSLPLSPELSLVENLSLSRDVIKSNGHPTINEVQQNNCSGPMDYTDYMISNVDVSVPLIDQECQVQESNEATQNKTDTVIKDRTANGTLSKSLDQKMKDLLLQSAQKTTQTNRQTPMEVDQTPITTAKKPRVRNRKINVDMDVDQSKADTSKKTRAKNRSSTPQKKKAGPKSKVPKDSIIEEEHKEFCTSGRQSCPPVINFISVDENANNSSDVTLPAAERKPKPKKDVIKVKILRPREKSGSRNKKQDKSSSNTSVLTDSGINNSENILLVTSGSVDLIHNHSDTCLMCNDECMVNSLEFVEPSSMSVISVTSSRQSEDSLFFKLFGEHAGSGETSNSRENYVAEQVTSDDNYQTADAALSPVVPNSSLITEDLSNSPKPTKWYLLEEDITNQESSNVCGVGSNLHQIFPVTCAVPNLSTITEKDNEDSRKATLDSDK